MKRGEYNGGEERRRGEKDDLDFLKDKFWRSMRGRSERGKKLRRKTRKEGQNGKKLNIVNLGVLKIT